MEIHDLEYFHAILMKQLNDLLKKNDDTLSLLLEFTADSPEFIDQATHEADRTLRLRMRDRENKLIRKINRVLARFENGTFGICDVCGDDIPMKRLKARPVTTYCIACKNKMETMEKGVGV